MKDIRKETIIIIHQTFLQSLLCDLATFLIILLLIGSGVLMESTAMQWLGFIMVIFICFSRSRNNPSIHRVAGFNEARKIITKLEQEQN